MAKKKTKSFEDKLEEIKKKFSIFSKEAMVLAKKGEKEFVRLSKEGKLHVDSATVGIKREHLLYLIGKEYVRLNCPGEKSEKLKKFMKELEDLKKKDSALKRTLKKVKK
ncbi:MAG: hypothetical protein PHY73_07530 [Candidatus Omnitrophica bacterium]|nr:hypothetical protein [Candidatus Omnitrophota bacterium]